MKKTPKGNKKEETKKPSLEMFMYSPPKPTFNEKTIGALKTLLNDEGFKCDLGCKYDNIIKAYDAGKKGGK
jgi:hypothetical protein